MLGKLMLLAAGAALLSANAHAIPRGELLGSTCLACHGPSGKSRGEIPGLAGLDSGKFVKSMRDYKAGARPSSVMKRVAAGYTDAEYEQMGEFFSRLKN